MLEKLAVDQRAAEAAVSKLTVLLPTYNCADTIVATLESICWADEILVVDSFSTDQTRQICAQYGARILQHEYRNSARQKNWALPHCKHAWVLQIDSDEVLEDQLRGEILAALQAVPDEVDAFRIRRKNHVWGSWMRHGGMYPDYQIRLFRRSVGRWSDREVHAHLIVPGMVVPLKFHILHQGMPNISRQLRNLDRYTGYEADEMLKRGATLAARQLIVHPAKIFLYRWLLKAGFKDGWRGLVISAYLAIYDFLTLVKVWERTLTPSLADRLQQDEQAGR